MYKAGTLADATPVMRKNTDWYLYFSECMLNCVFGFIYFFSLFSEHMWISSCMV